MLQRARDVIDSPAMPMKPTLTHFEKALSYETPSETRIPSSTLHRWKTEEIPRALFTLALSPRLVRALLKDAEEFEERGGR
jgi:hypothetical protein